MRSGSGHAIEEHAITFIADMLGQAGNFACASPVKDESGGAADGFDAAHFIRELLGTGVWWGDLLTCRRGCVGHCNRLNFPRGKGMHFIRELA